MKSKIRYSHQALRDIDAIVQYVAFDLNNPEAAKKIVDGIRRSIAILDIFPASGARLPSSKYSDGSYRFVKYKSYLAFYLEKDSKVLIVRIVYKKRNYEKLIPND
jgi:plasmid stabilization system protein ParE